MIYAVTLSGDVQRPLWSLTLQLTLDSELDYKWIAIPHPKNKNSVRVQARTEQPPCLFVYVFIEQINKGQKASSNS